VADEGSYRAACCSHLHRSRHPAQKELPYPLLSDPERVLIGALGATSEAGHTTRSHFVFEKGGKLVTKELPVTPKDR
jgi:peroxiredoxin Q/BCP